MTVPTDPSNEEQIAGLKRYIARVSTEVAFLKDRVRMLEDQVTGHPLGLVQALYPIWVVRAIEHVKENLSHRVENQDLLFRIDALRDAFSEMIVERLRDYIKALYKGENENSDPDEQLTQGLADRILEVLGPGNEEEDDEDG